MKRKEARMRQRIDFAKLQRRMSSDYVLIVWHWLRNRKVCGQKFRREHPIPPYTVDFFCVELGLIIEVDGQPHLTPEGLDRDQKRDRFMRSVGYEVLRITGADILCESQNTINRIKEFVQCAIERPKR